MLGGWGGKESVKFIFSILREKDTAHQHGLKDRLLHNEMVYILQDTTHAVSYESKSFPVSDTTLIFKTLEPFMLLACRLLLKPLFCVCK